MFTLLRQEMYNLQTRFQKFHTWTWREYTSTTQEGTRKQQTPPARINYFTSKIIARNSHGSLVHFADYTCGLNVF